MTAAATMPTPPRTRPRRRRPSLALVGGIVLVVMVLLCLGTLRWTLEAYNEQDLSAALRGPGLPWTEDAGGWMGTDRLGRSLLVRCLLGGAISLSIGLTAAAIAVVIGTTWGMVAGYAGGRVDSAMMRFVDVMYGLPYILLVVLLSVAFQPLVEEWVGSGLGNVVTLLAAIGAVSWLTLARVVRGQVLSIKAQPFVEAARASGCGPLRILRTHLLPNLVGPIIVYTTLTVPQAILQESFLSFLGIGVQAPLPSWGNLAAEGLTQLNPVKSHAWLLAWPCALLGMTLLALNFLGDGLRDRYDPRTLRKR